ncbi:hypothetical protein [Desulfogranum mediterraneum]|uniref:hypothetical protein n=1 Tax=Desulfogranum mediterraneum TaxID=160661 RepID=UPI0003F7AED3|nr:hypothetical protein [Desulfogranum mediterraneum]
MSEEVRFLPYEEASRLVAAIQEEENIHRPDYRVLTVYNHDNRELCWFDYEEVMEDAGIDKKDEKAQEKVTEYLLHRIPDWALDI